MKLNANNAGLASEKIAKTFLVNQGLVLITNNYHCRYGEIDLIMKDTNTLVFIEVRLRSNPNFGNAAASITLQKQRKMIHTAQHYLQTNKINMPCRFDALLLSKTDRTNIQWIRNAFDA